MIKLLLEIFTQEENICLQKDLNKNSHSSFIKMKTGNTCGNQTNVTYPYNKAILSIKGTQISLIQHG